MSTYCDYDYEIKSTNNNPSNNLLFNNKWRVKFYQLNDEGQWDDKGTGNVQINKLVLKI